jgi:hypothetical protein
MRVMDFSLSISLFFKNENVCHQHGSESHLQIGMPYQANVVGIHMILVFWEPSLCVYHTCVVLYVVVR